MYQDWKQWARAIYAIFLLLLVGWLIKPDQLIQYANWQEMNNLGQGMGFVQTSLFAISAGLLFPKTKKLEPDLDSLSSDFAQFIAGLFLSAIAWFITIL